MKRRAVILSIVLALSAGSVWGCGQKPEDPAISASVDAAEKETYTEADLAGLLEITDAYVLVNASLTPVGGYNESVVKAVTANTSGVDYATPGIYDVVYTATIDVDALEAYKAGKTDFTASGKDQTAEVKFNKKVEVVDEARAAELGAAGTTVQGYDYAAVQAAQAAVQADAAAAAAQAQVETEQAAADDPAPTETQTSTAKSSSGSSSGGSKSSSSKSSGSSSSKPSSSKSEAKPKHEHSWEEVGHYETQVVQAAWDEEITKSYYVCNNCDYAVEYKSGAASAMGIHQDSAGHINGYHTEKRTVGTKHHDAVTEKVWVSDGYRCSSCGATK